MIVLDSSAALDLVLANGRRGLWVAERIQGETVHAPHVIDIEVANVLRRLSLAHRITRPFGRRALSDFVALRMTRYPHVPLLSRIWQLSSNAYAADAAFLALAEALSAPLVTTDQPLARTPGTRATVEAFEA